MCNEANLQNWASRIYSIYIYINIYIYIYLSIVFRQSNKLHCIMIIAKTCFHRNSQILKISPSKRPQDEMLVDASANHGYVKNKNVFSFCMLDLLFNVVTLRVWKRCFDLKYLVWSPQTRLAIDWLLGPIFSMFSRWSILML